MTLGTGLLVRTTRLSGFVAVCIGVTVVGGVWAPLVATNLTHNHLRRIQRTAKAATNFDAFVTVSQTLPALTWLVIHRLSLWASAAATRSDQEPRGSAPRASFPRESQRGTAFVLAPTCRGAHPFQLQKAGRTLSVRLLFPSLRFCR
jgi:hypothetical protein